MNILGNIIWILFGGLLVSIEYIFGGIVLCLTIVGIPFGIQAFKLGVLGAVSVRTAYGCDRTGLGVPVGRHEPFVVDFRRDMDRSHPFGFRGAVVYYDYRNPVRSAAFQTDVVGIYTLRQGYYQLLAQESNIYHKNSAG